MNLVDANVLLYAVNEDAPHHRTSKQWLDTSLSSDQAVAFAWIAMLAFVRLATKPAIFPRPLTAGQALDRIDAWLASRSSVVVAPTADHAGVLRRLLVPLGTGGNLTVDAHLAALAVEHGCTIVTFDADFIRFEGVRSVSPAQLL